MVILDRPTFPGCLISCRAIEIGADAAGFGLTITDAAWSQLKVAAAAGPGVLRSSGRHTCRQLQA